MAEGRRLKSDADLQAQVASGAPLFPKFQPFISFVVGREKPPASIRPVDAALNAFDLLDRYSLFTCGQGEGDDDAPL